jgi:NADPH:quinone reductase-like Zn-dependent oxidoreductase
MPDLPRTMRAAYVDELGPADNIRYGELPVPAIGPTDVLVAVEAVAVDPVDTFIRSRGGGRGAYRTHVPLPFIIGRDLVGTVAATGPGVAEFQAGQRVWCNSLGHGGRQGSFAEYAVVPVERLYHLPSRAGGMVEGPVEGAGRGTGVVAAVALLHPAATAYLALFRHGALRPGETVLVSGAAGNLGTALVQLGAMAGARVIATCRGGDEDWCRRAGAAEVLDYRDADLGARLRAAAPDGVDVQVDSSGKLGLELAVDLLAPRGRIVVVTAGERPSPLPLQQLYTRDGRIVGFVISRAGVDELAEAAAAINRHLAAGTLMIRIHQVLPLERAADAHRLVEAGVRGRVVLSS